MDYSCNAMCYTSARGDTASLFHPSNCTRTARLKHRRGVRVTGHKPSTAVGAAPRPD
jgi:hypothetical protein